ncbi:MAG: hypothetical protein ACI8R8_001739, partial [Paraglaciecola sp.]
GCEDGVTTGSLHALKNKTSRVLIVDTVASFKVVSLTI